MKKFYRSLLCAAVTVGTLSVNPAMAAKMSGTECIAPAGAGGKNH